MAAASVHVPSKVGEVWLGTFGIAKPLATSAAQAAGPAPVSHHCVMAQFESLKQESAHAPVVWQIPPACVAPAAVHAALSPAVPHVVHDAPPPGQYGATTVHVAEVPAPLSPLHAEHVKVPLSQRGVAPAQLSKFAAVHSRQRPVPPAAAPSQT